MRSFNHFDWVAPYYDRFIKPSDASGFIALLKLPTSGYLLDAGGGTGRKSFPLHELVAGIVIADSSMGMLYQAHVKGSLMTVCTETEQLPFKAGSFERIIMVDALHHVADQHHTLAELWRLLQPGGRLVIEEPDICTLPVKILAVMEKLALMRSHFLSPQAIRAEFPYKDIEVTIHHDKTTAWIVADKLIP
jgi:demethylmenaquinone methyltransferase/2-methoxy-6-polyprenyl-1,4-benzoquinol methylase